MAPATQVNKPPMAIHPQLELPVKVGALSTCGSCLLRKKNEPQLHPFFSKSLICIFMLFNTFGGELGIPVKSDELQKGALQPSFFSGCVRVEQLAKAICNL